MEKTLGWSLKPFNRRMFFAFMLINVATAASNFADEIETHVGSLIAQHFQENEAVEFCESRSFQQFRRELREVFGIDANKSTGDILKVITSMFEKYQKEWKTEQALDSLGLDARIQELPDKCYPIEASRVAFRDSFIALLTKGHVGLDVLDEATMADMVKSYSVLYIKRSDTVGLILSLHLNKLVPDNAERSAFQGSPSYIDLVNALASRLHERQSRDKSIVRKKCSECFKEWSADREKAQARQK